MILAFGPKKGPKTPFWRFFGLFSKYQCQSFLNIRTGGSRDLPRSLEALKMDVLFLRRLKRKSYWCADVGRPDPASLPPSPAAPPHFAMMYRQRPPKFATTFCLVQNLRSSALAPPRRRRQTLFLMEHTTVLDGRFGGN